MASLRLKFLRSSIVRGIGANTYIQIVQSVAQFASVAVLAQHWGLKTYGVWLLLFSVPGYLSISDFGLAQSATAEMMQLMAQNRRAETLAIYQAARLATLITNLTGVAVAAALVLVVYADQLATYDALAGGHVPVILMALIGYAAVTLQNGVTGGAYTATGGYAVIGYAVGTMFAAETLSACLIVIAGGSLAMVAWSYFVIRLSGTFLLGLGLRWRAPWLTVLAWRSSVGHIRQLLRPAAALVALTVAQAASIQGTVAVVGLVSGPATVPVFTTVRTVSRVAAQAILIVNHALMPAFSVASATRDRSRMSSLTLLSIATSLVCASATLVGMLLLGRPFIAFWTHGVVQAPFPLILVMGLVMLANTTWQPISNLLMSVNRQEHFAYIYVLIAAAGVLLCFALVRVMGTTGAALSLLFMEGAMLWRIAHVARKLDIVNWREVPRQLADAGRTVRARLGR